MGTMAEIAENLHRREITALERSELLAKWVRLTEERRKAEEDKKAGEVAVIPRQVGGKRGRREGGIEKASRDLCVPAANLRRSVKIAALSPAAKEAAKSVGLADNQSALLAAAKEQTPKNQFTNYTATGATANSPSAVSRTPRA